MLFLGLKLISMLFDSQFIVIKLELELGVLGVKLSNSSPDDLLQNVLRSYYDRYCLVLHLFLF